MGNTAVKHMSPACALMPYLELYTKSSSSVTFPLSFIAELGQFFFNPISTSFSIVLIDSDHNTVSHFMINLLWSLFGIAVRV